MKVIFVGTVEFSYRMLRALLAQKTEIAGVITSLHRKYNSDYADLTPLCRKYGLSIHHTNDINNAETLDWVRQKQPDIIFCFGWSFLLKKELLNIPHMGCLGYHPALLPANRGRHPIIWALALGLRKTGSTFFMMNEGADMGDIVSQAHITIELYDDARSLYHKISHIAERQLIELIPKLEKGTFHRIIQDQASGNSWRKRSKLDGAIDWKMSCRAIDRLVKALTRPYVGAHFCRGDDEIKVWKVDVELEMKSTNYTYEKYENIEPGKVLKGGIEGALIKCDDGVICLREVDMKMPLQVGEYL